MKKFRSKSFELKEKKLNTLLGKAVTFWFERTLRKCVMKQRDL